MYVRTAWVFEKSNARTQYPVITAHTASREQRLHSTPHIITTSTNRNILQPTHQNRYRRKKHVKQIQTAPDKGKHRESTASTTAEGDQGSSSQSRGESVVTALLRRGSASSSNSSKSNKSQLVDLMVEDHAAEYVEQVRARKEGGSEWNADEPRHFVLVSYLPCLPWMTEAT